MFFWYIALVIVNGLILPVNHNLPATSFAGSVALEPESKKVMV